MVRAQVEGNVMAPAVPQVAVDVQHTTIEYPKLLNLLLSATRVDQVYNLNREMVN